MPLMALGGALCNCEQKHLEGQYFLTLALKLSENPAKGQINMSMSYDDQEATGKSKYLSKQEKFIISPSREKQWITLLSFCTTVVELLKAVVLQNRYS